MKTHALTFGLIATVLVLAGGPVAPQSAAPNRGEAIAPAKSQAKGQSNARSPLQDPSTQLHAAWLREVLDLDTAGAIAGYEAIANDTRANSSERWVAVARLAELKRLNVPAAKDFSTAEAPTQLRAALASATPATAILRLLAAVNADPTTVLPAIAAGTEAVPEVRPFTYIALEWVRSQIDLGQSQRLQRMRLRERSVSPSSDRWNAMDILRVELRGKPLQAEELRRQYFATWKPPQFTVDKTRALARARTRIDTWAADAETSSQQKAMLRSLREALDQRAAVDLDDALAFLSRLPNYADRLLEEPKQ